MLSRLSVRTNALASVAVIGASSIGISRSSVSGLPGMKCHLAHAGRPARDQRRARPAGSLDESVACPLTADR